MIILRQCAVAEAISIQHDDGNRSRILNPAIVMSPPDFGSAASTTSCSAALLLAAALPFLIRRRGRRGRRNGSTRWNGGNPAMNLELSPVHATGIRRARVAELAHCDRLERL
jgi:hypothetical protein